MRLESKIAIGIGVIGVGLGTLYMASGDKADQPDAVPPPLAEGERGADPTMAGGSTPDSPGGDSTGSTAATANRSGRRAKTGTVGSPSPAGMRDPRDRSSRPRPIAQTKRPGDLVLPSERTGLAGEPWPGRPTVADRNIPTMRERPASTRPAVGRFRPLPGRTTRTTTRPAGVGAAAKSPVPKSRMKAHVIQPGDTFSALAVQYFGDARHTGLILEANPDMDPRRLRIGQKVNIPPAPAASGGEPVVRSVPRVSVRPESAPPIPSGRAYTVQPGDVWYDLAKSFLGEGGRWPELYELNKERVSVYPERLRAGTVIELPTGVASANP